MPVRVRPPAPKRAPRRGCLFGACVPPRFGRPQAGSGEGGGQSPPSSPRREFESGPSGKAFRSPVHQGSQGLLVLVVPPRAGPPPSPRREFESGHCGDLIFSVFLARLNFSLFGQRKVTKEIPLRRGRFRFLPLLRTTLIETAKGDLRIPRWIPLGLE